MILNPMLMLRVMPDESGVVFDPENNCAMHLNQVGVWVWRKLEDETEEQAIVAAMASRFGLSMEQAQKDFDAFAAELQRRKLVVLEKK